MWVRDIWILSKIFSKNQKSMKNMIWILTFVPGVKYDHGSETNIGRKIGRLNLSKKKKKPKVAKVDVKKASLTHAMKKLKYLKGFSWFLFRFAMKN